MASVWCDRTSAIQCLYSQAVLIRWPCYLLRANSSHWDSLRTLETFCLVLLLLLPSGGRICDVTFYTGSKDQNSASSSGL